MGTASRASAVTLRIVSGGQTGVDHAALEFALARDWPHGGWCPHGRRTEAGPLEARYQLRETPSADYRQRTEWNVRDSDGTVIFSLAPRLTGGSAATAECARHLGKPWLHLTAVTPRAAYRLVEFVTTHGIKILNVAGPRASEEPEIDGFVRRTLEKAFPADRQAAATSAPSRRGLPNPRRHLPAAPR
jgi:hypothetical protein